MTGENLLGIAGLTPGGIGIWAIFGLALVSLVGKLLSNWISGMADRRRADTEGQSAYEVAKAAASAQLFEQMQAQLGRLESEVARLNDRIADLESEGRANMKEIIELRAGRQVEERVRQAAQVIVSADRMEGRA